MSAVPRFALPQTSYLVSRGPLRRGGNGGEGMEGLEAGERGEGKGGEMGNGEGREMGKLGE